MNGDRISNIFGYETNGKMLKTKTKLNIARKLRKMWETKQTQGRTMILSACKSR
jgi:hypothetical protein